METVSDSRYGLWCHLDATEYHALKLGSWSTQDIALGRELISDMVEVIRDLIRESDDSPIMETICRLVKDPDKHMVKMVERYDWD